MPSPRTAVERAAPSETLARVACEPFRAATDLGRAAAFWLAALLPLAYLPSLLTGTAVDQPVLFGSLMVAHVVALVLGRDYAADAA